VDTLEQVLFVGFAGIFLSKAKTRKHSKGKKKGSISDIVVAQLIGSSCGVLVLGPAEPNRESPGRRLLTENIKHDRLERKNCPQTVAAVLEEKLRKKNPPT